MKKILSIALLFLTAVVFTDDGHILTYPLSIIRHFADSREILYNESSFPVINIAFSLYKR